MPAFHEFLGILGPLLGIAFGFDAVSGERSQRTLPRLVAQPIHRDEIINGKFVAGIGAIALTLACLIAIVAGYGALRLGIGPTRGDLVRIVAFYVVAVVYISLWLALALLLSVDVPARRHRRAWRRSPSGCVLTLFAGLIAGMVADSVHGSSADSTTEQVLANARTRAERPAVLARSAVQGGDRRAAQPVTPVDGHHRRRPERHALPSTLPLDQSLLLAWWQLVALVAGTVVLFAAAYVVFMRQEVRA